MPIMQKTKTCWNNVWALLGPEEGLKNRFAQQIILDINNTLKKNKKETEIFESIRPVKFFLGDTSVEEVKQEIISPSLFSLEKILILEQVETINSSDVTKLVTVFQLMDETVFIILLSQSNKMYAAIENHIDKKKKKIFWTLSNADYEQYVIHYAQNSNMKFHPDAIDLLIQLVGENTRELKALLYVIELYAWKMTKGEETCFISKKNVEQWCAHYKTETVFSLFGMLSQNRNSDAFDILFSMLRSGESTVQIIAGLAYQFKIAISIKRSREQGIISDKAFLNVGVRSRSLQDQYKGFISFFSLVGLQKILCICEETDYALRGDFDARYKEIIMSKMLYDIISMQKDKISS